MIGFIDGDVLAHKCCKSRFKKPSSDPAYTDIQTIVHNRFEHKFTKEEDSAYLEASWKIFQEHLAEAVEACFLDDYLMAVKSDVNYRDEIYPMTWREGADKTKEKPLWGYKANRWKPPQESNQFVPVIRKLAIHQGLALEAYGREADDLLRIWAGQASLAGDPYVIMSIDKDLDCIPGKHYNFTTKQIYEVSERDAMRFSYQQMLSGDTTDNIPGVPGLGPVKAEKFLYNIHEEDELQEIIVEMYMNAYEDNWYEMLLSNGKLLHLQRHANDHFTVSNWPVVQAFWGTLKKHNKVISLPKVVEAVREVSVVQASSAPTPKLPLSLSAPSLRAPTAAAPVLPPSPPAAPKLAITPPEPAKVAVATAVGKLEIKRSSPSLLKVN